MSSSSAISLVKPLVRAARPCPYCDHTSPADSKFCGACGAALHLVPCLHCGAVNDVTKARACYRCHGELQEENAAAPVIAPAEAEMAAPILIEAEPVEPQGRQRPPMFVVIIVLLAFAAASYYAYRQRGAMDGREAASTAVKSGVNPADTGAVRATGVVNKVAVEAASSPVAPAAGKGADKAVASPAVSAPPANISKSEAVSTAPVSAPPPLLPARKSRAGIARDTAAISANTAETARALNDAGKGIDKQPSNIGPCTDAIAALGLCTPESTQRKQ